MFPGSLLPVLGLTGATGAGKSAAAAILQQLGCAILDGDRLAREVVAPGSPVLAALAAHFGADILDASGALHRALLAARAFASPEDRAALGALTHPAIGALAAHRVAQLPPGAPAVVVDAAALPESEILGVCDQIVVITAPEEVRLRRILVRDGIPEAAARQRIEAQRSLEYESLARGGHKITVIENGGAAEDMRPALEGVLRYLTATKEA